LNFPSMTFGGYSVSYYDPSRKKGDRNLDVGRVASAEKAKEMAQRVHDRGVVGWFDAADKAKAEALS
jgi:hypothetical protein